MSSQCNIVKDLIPLRIDGVCSEASCVLVDEHLKTCQDCSRYMEEMTGDLPGDRIEERIEESTVASQKNAFKKVRKGIRYKVLSAALISFLAAVLAIGGIYHVLNRSRPVQYESGVITFVQTSKNMTDIVYKGKGYSNFISMSRTVDYGNHSEYALYLYLEKSLWSQITRKGVVENPIPWSGSGDDSTSENQKDQLQNKAFKSYGTYLELGDNIRINFGGNGGFMLFAEENREIDAVYYLIGNYMEIHQLDNDAFIEATKDALLLWNAD